MKSYRHILIILLASTCITYSQNLSVTVEKPDQSEFPDELLVARYLGSFYKETISQFIEDWKRGDIVLSTGTVKPNQLIRYNHFQDELVWLRETDYKMGVLIKESIKEFSFYPEKDEPKRVFRKMLVSKSFVEGDKETFVQILVDGENSVICHRKLNKVGSTDEYQLVHHYFLVRNGMYTRFNLRKSSILDLFDNDEKQKMKTIIRSNHLKMREEQAMIRAFELFFEK